MLREPISLVIFGLCVGDDCAPSSGFDKRWLVASGGYTAQAIGLEYTTAARGAFTGTFTVLAVPLLVGLSGRKVPGTTWAAAVVALIGELVLVAATQ